MQITMQLGIRQFLMMSFTAMSSIGIKLAKSAIRAQYSKQNLMRAIPPLAVLVNEIAVYTV